MYATSKQYLTCLRSTFRHFVLYEFLCEQAWKKLPAEAEKVENESTKKKWILIAYLPDLMLE